MRFTNAQIRDIEIVGENAEKIKRIMGMFPWNQVNM